MALSSQFKKLDAEMQKFVKAGGNIFSFPTSILFDKLTGKVKEGPKNLVAYKYVQLFNDLPENEQKQLFANSSYNATRAKHGSAGGDVTDYLKNLEDKARIKYGSFEHNLENCYSQLPELIVNYNTKKKEIEIKLGKEKEKQAKADAQAQTVKAFNSSEIVKGKKLVKKAVEPYIKKGEKAIAKAITDKFKMVISDYQKLFLDEFNKEHGTDIRIGSTPNENARKTIKLPNGNHVTPDSMMTMTKTPGPFLTKYMDSDRSRPPYYYLTSLAKAAINSSGPEVVIAEAQRVFRQAEELRVEALFYRIFKAHPQLGQFVMTVPYNGDEFTLECVNGAGEKIVINTNTVWAGGYNIQRYHSRWLVRLTNTVTGKKEKFEITDKDTAAVAKLSAAK